MTDSQLKLALAVAMKCAHILARGISSHESTMEATLDGCYKEVNRVAENNSYATNTKAPQG